MKWIVINTLAFLLLASTLLNWHLTPTVLEEVCDNGIDDDADDLIDLNDPDCSCASAAPFSLIPNPSFEDKSCCPNSNSQLDCADTWIQASAATTDYMHTCGWLGWENIPLPLPIPDGEGCVGYRNGRFAINEFSGVTEPKWKEYVGACLLSPLRANTDYTFRFNLGFSNAENSPPTEVVFYGTSACENLPFGTEADRTFGCPSNDPNWRILGSLPVIGNPNSWVEREINITPQADVHAIAIGPSCKILTANNDLFYFFDNLILADQKAFEFEVTEHGNPCIDTFSLQIPDYDSLQYQWYRDGIAIEGAIGAMLQPVTEDGNYQVRLTSSEGCTVTKGYLFERPFSSEIQEVTICEGEAYSFHSQTLRESGTYYETLKSADYCDSTIQLNLQIATEAVDSITAKIFPGETYKAGSYEFTQAGEHLATLQTPNACDSLLYIELDFYQVYIPNAFSPNDDGVNDTFYVFGDQDLLMIESLRIFDRWGQLVYEGKELPPNDASKAWDGNTRSSPLPNGVYVYSVRLLMEDGGIRHKKGAITLLR